MRIMCTSHGPCLIAGLQARTAEDILQLCCQMHHRVLSALRRHEKDPFHVQVRAYTDPQNADQSVIATGTVRAGSWTLSMMQQPAIIAVVETLLSDSLQVRLSCLSLRHYVRWCKLQLHVCQLS